MKKISKEELEEIYLNNPISVACEILGVTRVTLIKYVKKAGIKTKGKGNRNPKSKIIIEG